MEYVLNEKIRANFVLLIDSNGENKGVVFIKDALNLAREKGLDLVQINDNEKPVCKIFDYGKFKYERNKNVHHNSKDDVKEVRIGYTTQEHDISYRAKQITSFLNDGYKVKFCLMMTGREKIMTDLAQGKFNDIVSAFSDIANIGSSSISYGKDNKNRDATFISAMITPAKKKSISQKSK